MNVFTRVKPIHKILLLILIIILLFSGYYFIEVYLKKVKCLNVKSKITTLSELIECHRIVKPGGFVIAIYNLSPGGEMVNLSIQAINYFFTNPETLEFPNPIEYTKDNWLAYMLSMDNIPLSTDHDYDDYISIINEDFDRESSNGVLLCNKITKVYWEGIEKLF